jgi:DUF4097 and DUF4098 domain-containing protein YvlB
MASRFRVDFRREAYRTRARLRIRGGVAREISALQPWSPWAHPSNMTISTGRSGTMRRFTAIALAAFSAVALGASENIDKVNGSIRIDGSRTVGDLSTVNGSIDVGEDARAEELETVNGSIQLKPRVVAESAETVNGSISVGADAQVLQSAETVNGRITLEKRAQVGGRLETVNGDLLLDEAKVGGQLRTVNGDITVGAASHVGGGILVEES